MLHARVSEPAKLAALRTLSAAFRSAVAAAYLQRTRASVRCRAGLLFGVCRPCGAVTLTKAKCHARNHQPRLARAEIPAKQGRHRRQRRRVRDDRAAERAHADTALPR